MRTARKHRGTRMTDLYTLVENLQKAMGAEDIPFAPQNRILAKLAPIPKDVLER